MNSKCSLSNYFSLNRRYSRSINLERDFELPDTILGYVLTDRAIDAFRRIFSSIVSEHSLDSGRRGSHAWTLTGVYGTGKSAFVHYLISLSAPESSLTRKYALDIAQKSLGKQSKEYKDLVVALPKQGFFRAIAVGQQEPLR